MITKTILTIVAILLVGACGTTQNLHKNDPVLQNQLIGGYEYVKKHQSFALKEQPIGSKYKMVLTGKLIDQRSDPTQQSFI